MPNDDNRPQPPQPEQRQTPPGTTSDMTPKPDHGEHSYKGSGRLAGKTAIITGSDFWHRPSGGDRVCARRS